ncbi:hypothetical protein [Ornithinimicrobium sp. INDO-MA30-4]|uniref:hypothetical protein n=1 Tax=Ornithinimicrobium sp. INDO-MA30-4 TaxID=2908651 RepID=UPI001F3348B3|nr:hypothetical protein [Ornithinimicrobium sp. INDO-MA30-4]UJH71240.1 hypothetical protein L0A91_05410 [Ornithinimicrobium sp. INDO-MA30-4]
MVYRLHRDIDREIALPEEGEVTQRVPSRVLALVYVEHLDSPTLRAVAYARATRPQSIEAVSVDINADRSQELRDAWRRHKIPVTLRLLESPYREPARPLVDYVGRLHRDHPRDMVVVYVPEYVAANRFVRWVRNRALNELRSELMRTPGVIVATVPWQADARHKAQQQPAPSKRPAQSGESV